MSRLTAILLAGLAGILLLAGVGFAEREAIGLGLFERVVRQNLARDVVGGLPDGLHLILCGTGSPMPDATRAGPCALVVAGPHLFMVDAGDSSVRTLLLAGVQPGRIEAVLLTHFHSDHIAALGEAMMQRWVGGAHTAPLPIHGPPGVEEVVAGFNMAYRLDGTYRVAHHGEAVAPTSGTGGIARPFDLPTADPDGAAMMEVLRRDGLTVTAFTVDHDPVEPAVGYRFDYKGRSLVISGDTAAMPSMARIARGTDLLVHEALQPRLVTGLRDAADAQGNAALAKIADDILDYHATPGQAAEIAAAAGARHLILTHVVPPLPLRILYPAFLGDAADRFDGPITVGEDGMLFSLPAGSAAIHLDRLP